MPPSTLKELPGDNVYALKYYHWKIFSAIEAIHCHRETHHPTIYNQPDADVMLKIELNMQAEKPVSQPWYLSQIDCY